MVPMRWRASLPARGSSSSSSMVGTQQRQRCGLFLLGTIVVVVTLLLSINSIAGVDASSRLPIGVDADVQAALGSEAFDTAFQHDASDSIDVVPHEYFAPSHNKNEADDRSLIHAAESISHTVDAEMEEATYSDIPELVSASSPSYVPSSSSDNFEQASYTTAVDPSFLLETASQGARERAEEYSIGLIEKHAEVKHASGAEESVSQSEAMKRTVGPIVGAPDPLPAPKDDKFISPEYAETVKIAPTPAAKVTPKEAAAATVPKAHYIVPTFREAPMATPTPAAASKKQQQQYFQPKMRSTPPPAPQQQQQASKKASTADAPKKQYIQPETRSTPAAAAAAPVPALAAAHKNARIVTQTPRGWAVASPTSQPVELKPETKVETKKPQPTPTTQEVKEKKQTIAPEIKPTPTPQPRTQARTQPQSQAPRRRRRKSTMRKVKKAYIQPSFYPVHKPQPAQKAAPKPKRKSRPQPMPMPEFEYEPVYEPRRPRRRRGVPVQMPHDPRILVNTPHGPVYVLYVTKPKAPAPAHVRQVSYNMHPSATKKVSPNIRGIPQVQATYELPKPPRSPYERQEGQRRPYSAVERVRAEIARAQAESKRQAEMVAKNTQYDPETNTIVRHVHTHRYTRAPKPQPESPKVVAVITPVTVSAREARARSLKRAYIKLCRLQRALMKKYAREHHHVVSDSAYSSNNSSSLFPHVVSRATRLNTKYSPVTRASELGSKYASSAKESREKVYRRAQALIRQAEAWHAMREARREARREVVRQRRREYVAAKSACRRRAHQLGLEVPPSCRRLTPAQKAQRRAAWVTRRSARRAARAHRRSARREAKRQCRARFYAAGQAPPKMCLRTPSEVRHARRIVSETHRARRRAAWRERCATKRACRRQARLLGIEIPPACQGPSRAHLEAVRAWRAERRRTMEALAAQRDARRVARKLRESRPIHMSDEVKLACRREARARGIPVPQVCALSDGSDGKVEIDVIDRVHANAIRRAKRHCRDVARAEGLPIPKKCMPDAKKTGAVFKKKRYDPKTNKVRFQQVQAQTEAAAAVNAESEVKVESETVATTQSAAAPAAAPVDPLTQTALAARIAAEEAAELKAAEAETAAAFEPIDGLDFNQSPMMKSLLKKLRAQNQAAKR